MKIFSRTLAIGISLVTATLANASNWSGLGPDGFISNAGNWDIAPTSGGANFLNFGGSLNLSVSNNIDLTTADQVISFLPGASAFTIKGAPIRVGSITNNSSVMQSIIPSLRLNGTRVINVGTGGIFLGTPVGSTSTSARTVTKVGSGDLVVTGGVAISGGSGYSVGGGGLVFSNSVTQTIGLGSGGGGVSLTANGTSVTFKGAGNIGMGGAISTVAGSSVLLNSTGITTVTNGVSIALGAFLSGKGNLQGGLLSVAGDMSPGINGIGTLTVSNLVFSSTATVEFDLDRAAGQNADLISANSVIFNGALNVTNDGTALQLGDSFNLFDGGLSGTFSATNLPSLDAGLGWDFSQFSSQGILSVDSVPEPTTVALFAVGVSAVAWRRRRKA